MDRLLELDKQIFLALNFDGGTFWDEFFWIVSGKLTWVPLYVLIMYLLIRRYGWKYALLAAVFIGLTVGITDQVAGFFKDFVPKFRPTHDPEIFPQISLVRGYRGYMYGTVSAHAATTFGIMTVSSSLVRARWFTVATILWAVLVSYSRIYIGAHFPMDILLGATLGIVTGLLMVRLMRFTWRKLTERFCVKNKKPAC